MQSRLRSIRKSRGLTLADVAARCSPPTTAVTIGRLETGMRKLSLPWLERLARALEVAPADLLPGEAIADIPVAAILTHDGPEALAEPLSVPPPSAGGTSMALLVHASTGEYRAGDTLWLEQLPPDHFAQAMNADILAPRPVGRFAFGRLVGLEAGRLHIIPPTPGSRQVVVSDPPWIARATILLRRL
jgi:transcriptional regulator with XRE-family HTH domain